MEKIAFGELMIEITRRCNMKCPHCFRGEAQNLDIGEKEIDAILDQTLAIETLFITGGEPFMAIEQMEYLLNAIKKRNIIIPYMNMVTNGTVMNEKVIKILFEYDKYIRDWHEKINKIEQVEDDTKFIEITVSSDKYHDNDPSSYISWVRENLGNIVEIDYQVWGSGVIKCGRAVNLHEAVPELEERNSIFGRIAIYGKNKPCHCRTKPKWDIEPDYFTIMCPQYYTATGKLVKFCHIDYIEEDNGKRDICNVINGESIIDSINKWNKSHKLLCFEVNSVLDKKHLLKEPEYHSRWIEYNYHLNKKTKDSLDAKGGVDEFNKTITEEDRKAFIEAQEAEDYFNTKGKYNIIGDYRYGEYKSIYLKYRFLTPIECELFKKLENKKDDFGKGQLKIRNYGREILNQAYDIILTHIDLHNKMNAICIIKYNYPKMKYENFKEFIAIANKSYTKTDTEKTFMNEIVQKIWTSNEMKEHRYDAKCVSEFIPYYEKFIMENFIEYLENIRTLNFNEEDYYKIKGYKYIIDMLKEKNIITKESLYEVYDDLYKRIDEIACTILELSKSPLLLSFYKLMGKTAW